MKNPARWGILALLFVSIGVNLLDRQVLSVLAPVIRDELHLTNTQYSYIVVSFLVGLTLAQVPAGMLMDRWGPRLGLPLIMFFWSIANGLHAAARGIRDLCSFRFLMGAGECGNYSAGIKVISQWFPPEERALAGGIFNSGTVIGALFAPPIIVAIFVRFGWRMAFILPSVLGLLWIIPWLLFYRQRERPAAAAKPVPTLPLLRIRQVWGAILMRACCGPVLHFYWYWLPEYLKRERHFSMRSIALLAGVPFLFAGLGNVVGGWFSGHMMRRGWTADRARKLSFMLGAALCTLSVLAPIVHEESLAIALICAAIFGVSGFVATNIGMLTDIFPGNILARMAGLTGFGEGIVNIAMMLATGVAVDHFSYLPIFLLAGALPAVGVGFLFILIRRIERFEISA